MSRNVSQGTISRPHVFDFLLLLLGGALSLYLMRLNPLAAMAGVDHEATAFVALLPQAMRLPEGMILLFPLFLGIQSLGGRSQPLTALEWLWVLAWVGCAALTGMAACRNWGWLPASFETQAAVPLKFWYLIVQPSMAALGLAFATMGLVGRKDSPPWTNGLALALLVWPVIPLAGILALGKFG